ncbi:hypothetical protein ACJMK2_006496 [Sinanodonta woodiana]|uniref:Hexosyltransferase n=1 Tax=Sinanodonta woodiana TaxID=1069815 RepID=A0ABD3VTB1_SINWO
MVTILTLNYRKLGVLAAVIIIVLIIYKDVVWIYVSNKIEFSDKGFLKNVLLDQVTYFDNNGKSDCIIPLHDDIMIPGKYAWIPYPVERRHSGPFIIAKNSGERIKYTNYTFYPLTFNSSFLINNPNICNYAENLTFLIMVHTSMHHFDRRKALRDTWANPRLLKNHQSRILFLVGRGKSNIFQKSLEIESEEFKDIIQGDFIDDYHNLTHKGILGFRWVTTYCENAKFIFKIDDDIFVNIFLVIQELLPKLNAEHRMIACRLLLNETIARDGKFAADLDYFPGYKRSPLQYCAGPFVLIPRDIVPEMYEAAKSTPFYWIDDFYLFGILPNQIGNVSFHHVASVNNNEDVALKCFQDEKPCTYLAAYTWTQGIMYKYWESVLFMYKDLVQIYALNV